MTSRQLLVPRWRREVYRSRKRDSVRVFLLYLSDHMNSQGFVSIPRTRMAADLNRDERRIAEWIAAAIEAGLLARIRSGKPGVTAEYKAMMPGVPSVRSSSGHWPPKGADNWARAKLVVQCASGPPLGAGG